ncbi:MAG: hypothetical protein ACYTAO_06530, partial [Planctomycetota bacterium]
VLTLEATTWLQSAQFPEHLRAFTAQEANHLSKYYHNCPIWPQEYGIFDFSLVGLPLFVCML